MSRSRWSFLSNRHTVVALLLLACLFTLHCDEGDDVFVSGSGPYALRFSLAGDFQIYGGQTISWALLRSDNGEKLVAGRGTISATTNPAFSVNTGNVMLLGVPHQMHYWIDSNIGGGTEGVCDPVVRAGEEGDGEILEAFDKQWIAPFGGSTSDLSFIAIHDPDRVLNVCDTFPY